MKKQAAFLFGSGISIPSKVPSVYQITDAARDEDWHLTTLKTFEPGVDPNPLSTDAVTPSVKAFLATLTTYAADCLNELKHLHGSRRPHYEDLFSLAEQAARPETDHAPNLAVVEFVRRLRKDTESLHLNFKGGSGVHDGFVGLAEAACDFLHWVVHHKLRCAGGTRIGLELISQIAREVEALDLFTLNHDVLVEPQLKADGITELEFGFHDHTHCECAVFSAWPAQECHPRKTVRIFKLHGSLNWYRYDFPDGSRQYAIPDGDPYHCHDQNKRLLTPVDWKAAFLSGTVVKEQRYATGPWEHLFANFRSHLSKHTHLMCCGYGFGDTGINQRVVQWMHDRPPPGNRLVILTPEPPDPYFVDKPVWLTEFWREGRVDLVPKYLEKCALDDLRYFFDDPPK